MRRLFVLIAAVLLLCSCSEVSKHKEENTGVLVDKEGLEAVSEAQNRKERIYCEGIDEEMYVFCWTENGSVFHADESCSFLSNSKKLIFGNIHHAYDRGVENKCSVCFEK